MLAGLAGDKTHLFNMPEFEQGDGPSGTIGSVWHPHLTSSQKGRVEKVSNEVVYEGDAGKQSRPGTSAHPRGVTETRTNIARKPATLSHEAAASVPIGALTAWQGLIDRAKLEPGQRVLVHGGAGAVGLYAVQLAHIRGARVITTVAAQDIDFVKRLGADQAIDYKASRFEKEVRDVDVVFDAVGGDTLERSWGVLKPDGRMITIAADSEGTADQRVKDAFFIVEPNQKQLVEIAKQLDAGHLRAFVKATVPLSEAAAAYSGAVRDKSGYGKIVIAVPPDACFDQTR